jgi:type I restriction enzyme M protein
VFAEVCQELNPPIIFAEAQSIGYKRTKRGENPKPNNLYQVSANGEVTFDTKNPKAILDYIKRGNIWQ